jgi:hypothetical protein
MMKKTSKTVWSTIKFPHDFVANISAYSKENGWKSSCEFIMAAVDFIHKFNLDLHGELPRSCQTDVVFLIDAMKIVVNKLNEFPDKANLIQQVNQLKADLSSTQKELDKSNKANSSWQKTNDSLKAEKQDALDELEKQRQEVSRLTAMTKTQDERLQSITLKVNDTLQQINAENSSWGRFGVDGKKLAIALETLRWVTSETSNPP